MSQKSDTKQQRAVARPNRPPRRRPGRRARMRNARSDDDVVTRSSGHQVTINGRGSFNLLKGLLGPIATALIDPLMSMFIGEGDYKVKKNSLILEGQPPKLSSNGSLGVNRFQHREFLGYVTAGANTGPGGFTSFNLQSFLLNPGQVVTFPWLSQIASAYQEYEILGMVVAYRSTSGNATGANTSLGEVIISTNYNSSAPNFSNTTQMLNAEYANQGKPSEDFLHMIECEPHQNPVSELYVRTGAVPTGQDQRLFDFANLQVATQGCQTVSQQLGELWLTYDIQMYKPILGGIVSGQDIPTDHFQLTTVAGSTPLGTSQKSTIAGGLGGTINGATGTIYTFPASVTEGSFLFLYQAQGTAANTTAFTMTGSTSFAYVSIFATNVGPDLKSFVKSTDGVMNAVYIHAFMITIVPSPTVPVSVTFGAGGTLPTAPCFGDLIVTQVNSGLVGLLKNPDLSSLVQQEVLRQLSTLTERRKSRGIPRRIVSVCAQCGQEECSCIGEVNDNTN